jgi:hypothetical protein
VGEGGGTWDVWRNRTNRLSNTPKKGGRDPSTRPVQPLWCTHTQTQAKGYSYRIYPGTVNAATLKNILIAIFRRELVRCYTMVLFSVAPRDLRIHRIAVARYRAPFARLCPLLLSFRKLSTVFAQVCSGSSVNYFCTLFRKNAAEIFL